MSDFFEKLEEELGKTDPDIHAIALINNVVNNGLTIDSAFIIAKRKHGNKGIAALTKAIEEWNKQLEEGEGK